MKPSAPVMMNAHSQPYVMAIHGTVSGATIAPTFEPELKMPVASARSFFGNHSATVLMAAGKLPASPSPSAKRATPKPTGDRASACPIAAIDHQTMATEKPLRGPTPYPSLPPPAPADGRPRERMPHRCNRPPDDGEREALARPEPVHQVADHQQPDGVGGLKRRVDVAVLGLVPTDGAFEIFVGGKDAEHLPVDVVDRRRKEQQRADAPAVASDPSAPRFFARR